MPCAPKEAVPGGGIYAAERSGVDMWVTLEGGEGRMMGWVWVGGRVWVGLGGEGKYVDHSCNDRRAGKEKERKKKKM